MELISCGKNIQLHSFPKLASVSTFGQVEGRGCYDFQFFRKSKFFIASNSQKPAVEYLSLKHKDEAQGKGAKVSLVKRMNMDNLCCIASPKSNLEYVALGLTTGHIRLINYKTAEVAYRFPPDSFNNRIISMDFSSTDDYLAAISETGSARLFGMKSFIEMDSFNIDKHSTLGRFHPSKRFQLVVASYLGNISIYDAQVKKKTFHLTRAHTCPCRDISMSSVNDTCLFSVGLDCYINIYDTRKKSVAQQIKTEHPLSAIALTASSMECVVGNLKGEIVLFDVRKMSQALVTVQAHENLVNRLAFVPPERMEVDFQATSQCESKEDNCSAVEGGSLNESVEVFSLLPSNNQKRNSDMGGDRRDSFMDFINDHMNTIENSGPSSDNADATERRRSRRSMSEEDQEETPISRNSSFVTIRKKRSSGQSEPKLSDVKEVEEEPVNGQGNLLEVKSPHSFSNLLPESRNSTPKGPETAATIATAVESLSRQEIAEMIKRSENELKYEMNTLKWETYGEMFSLWQNQNRAIEKIAHQVNDISDAMSILLRGDEFTNEFVRLQRENEILREQLARKNLY